MTLEEFKSEWDNDSTMIHVRTSGSTGEPKQMLVDKARMEASARTTCDFLGLRAGDTALLCMSLDYIGAKMMVVRTIVRGLRLVSVEPSGHPFRDVHEPITFAAMVPMQVYNSLSVPEERSRLLEIKHLIIGGGAIDDALAHKLEDFPNAVWSTYGMTETLSHIALRRLNGAETSDYYTPFDSVSVSLNADNCLVIDAPLICTTTLTTNDIAEIAPDGRRFRVVGRKDNVINSGGIKIQIEAVEHALKGHLDMPYMVTRRKDAKFGEIVALLIESEATDRARRVCADVLPKYWQPRAYIIVSALPITGSGKPNRAEAERMAAPCDEAYR